MSRRREVDATGKVTADYEVPDPPEVTNENTLDARVAQALSANQQFLALTSPTNAQVVAQVRLLTREASALIRLLTRRLDSAD